MDPSPLPFAFLMILGFVVGAAGHVWRSRTVAAIGIGMVFLGALLLPLWLYLKTA